MILLLREAALMHSVSRQGNAGMQMHLLILIRD